MITKWLRCVLSGQDVARESTGREVLYPMTKEIHVIRAPLGSASAGWEVVGGVLVVVADPALCAGQVADIVAVARLAVESGQRSGAR